MSTELAVSAVTRALRNLMIDGVKLDDGMVPLALTKGLEYTMLPLHKVRENFKVENCLNLFLYRVETNAAWRNHALPTAARPGEDGPPPLALNLEYLVSAYGEEDREEVAHFLLGKVMRLLHDNSFLSRDRLKTAMEPARVHEQIESIKVTPHTLTIEELSKLWTVFQTQYRISAAYEITVVLIDSKVPARSALPVLKRGKDDRGVETVASAPPLLASAVPATGFAFVRLGDDVLVNGARLDVPGLKVRLTHDLATIDSDITAVSPSQFKVTIPAPAVAGTSHKWPAGLYTLTLLPAQTTDEVTFGLAPSITVAPLNHAAGTFELTIDAKPQIRPEQESGVRVLLGNVPFTPKSFSTPLGDLDAATTVKVDVTAASGLHRVRLRVEGVDSIPITKTGDTFDFDINQTVQVP